MVYYLVLNKSIIWKRNKTTMNIIPKTATSPQQQVRIPEEIVTIGDIPVHIIVPHKLLVGQDMEVESCCYSLNLTYLQVLMLMVSSLRWGKVGVQFTPPGGESYRRSFSHWWSAVEGIIMSQVQLFSLSFWLPGPEASSLLCYILSTVAVYSCPGGSQHPSQPQRNTQTLY